MNVHSGQIQLVPTAGVGALPLGPRFPETPVRVVATEGDRCRRAADENLIVRELAIAIAQARTVESAIELTLREICALTDWSLGQAWTCKDGSHLECSPAWCASSTRFRSFRSRSESMTFERGAGLPGRAWSEKRPVWLTDVRTDPDFPRAPFAREAGLVAGLAVPVLAEDQVVGVLEFFIARRQRQDKRLTDLVSTAAAQLGALIRRKHAEEALRASEECLRLLVDSVEDVAIFKLDPSGQVASWNHGAERITGYSAEEITGYHVSRLYAPEAVQDGRPERQLELASAAGRFEELDWRVRSDGLRFWASVVITALHDDRGRLRGFSHVIRDATAQKRNEDELQRLRAIVRYSDDAIVSLTPDKGIITTWNRGAERLFGYSAREVVGRSVALLVPPEACHGQRDVLEGALKQDRVAHHELEVLRKNGSRVDVAVTISPIKDANEETVAVSAVARDITDRKCAQRHLERAFGTYLDREVAEHILTEGPAITGDELDVTMIFLDIRDFTTVAERLEPADVVEMLNRFFELAVPIITAYGGHVDKFVGDGLLAVFGAPRPQRGHADKAVQAALEIECRASEHFSGEFEIGIGIHSGTVVAGNVGGGGRLDFTVIGDAVNTAARIESATRQTGDTILFSEETRKRLQELRLPLVERPAVLIRGKRTPTTLYSPDNGLSSVGSAPVLPAQQGNGARPRMAAG
jgi:PAS domain S-box-containing protein